MAKATTTKEPWDELIEVVTIDSATGHFDVKFRLMRTPEGNILLDVRKRSKGNNPRYLDGVTIKVDSDTFEGVAAAFANMAVSLKQAGR